MYEDQPLHDSVFVKQSKPPVKHSKMNKQFHIQMTFLTQWTQINDRNKQTHLCLSCVRNLRLQQRVYPDPSFVEN